MSNGEILKKQSDWNCRFLGELLGSTGNGQEMARRERAKRKEETPPNGASSFGFALSLPFPRPFLGEL
jgi:hypothetical protein